MNRFLNISITQLMKRNKLYEHIGKRLKFLANLTQNTFSTSERTSMTNCLMCVINTTDTKDYTKQENLKCPEILQHTFGRI